jgi:hypothetical protein
MTGRKPKHEAGRPRLWKRICLLAVELYERVKELFQRTEESVVKTAEKVKVVAKTKAAVQRWANEYPVAANMLRAGLCVALMVTSVLISPPLGMFIHFKAIWATVCSSAHYFWTWHSSLAEIRDIIVWMQPPGSLITLPTAVELSRLVVRFYVAHLAGRAEPDVADLWREVSWARIILEKVFGVSTVRGLFIQLSAMRQAV